MPIYSDPISPITAHLIQSLGSTGTAFTAHLI